MNNPDDPPADLQEGRPTSDEWFTTIRHCLDLIDLPVNSNRDPEPIYTLAIAELYVPRGLAIPTEHTETLVPSEKPQNSAWWNKGQYA